MTDLALDLQNAAVAMGTHDAMIAVIADVRAVLPRFIVPSTTRVLHGADEDGEPFLTIALPNQRVSIYADADRLGCHAIVRGELGTSAVPSEDGSVDFGEYSAGAVSDIVHFGAYSAEALPDILSLLFDEAPLCILSTQAVGRTVPSGSRTVPRIRGTSSRRRDSVARPGSCWTSVSKATTTCSTASGGTRSSSGKVLCACFRYRTRSLREQRP